MVPKFWSTCVDLLVNSEMPFGAVYGNLFFRGGVFWGRFERWSISSHIRVQITSESVRSIALIGLNMFSTHNVSDKSLKFFLRPRF